MDLVFPPEVDKPRDRMKRARNRLRYILKAVALRKYGHTSVHQIARDANCSHAGIFNAINRGRFTEDMAKRIEAVFGREVLKHEVLLDPFTPMA